MVGKSSVGGFVLFVQNQVDEVKSGQESWWKPDVVDDRELGVILTLDGVCGSKDGGTSVKSTDDTSLGD